LQKFSIILPVKNGGDYVKECVDSILNQSYNDFNVFILDNNSDDGTLQWLQTLKDSRITIIPSSVSLSMEANWARIKELPKNEYMTIIGHDDLFHEHYLQEVNHLIFKYPDASLYQTHFNFIDQHGNYLRKCQNMDEVQTSDDFLKCHILHTLDSMGTGYLYRSKDYDTLGGIPADYPNLIFADYQLWIELTSISYKATSERVCFSYRLHNSVSKKTNGELYQIAFEKYFYFLLELCKTDKKIKSVLDQHGKKLLMYYCESLCHRLLKTDPHLRKIKVGDTIDNYEDFAKKMIPEQVFAPRKKLIIKMAEIIDNFILLKKIFLLLKK